MIVGLCISGNLISTLFDNCLSIEVYKIEDNKPTFIKKIDLNQFLPMISKLNIILENNIDTIICGAIRRYDFIFLMQNNLKVIPFITGNKDLILTNFLEGKIQNNMMTYNKRKFRYRGGKR